MTPAQYKSTRQLIGSQAAVARLLGVEVITIKRREKPGAKIAREAALALERLAQSDAKKIKASPAGI